MQYALVALAAFASVAVAAPQGVTADITPTGGSPPGCTDTYPGTFEITVVKPSKKRDVVERQAATTLEISLANGQLTDSEGRTGYIAANYQFQFDGPPQTGAIYTGGWSICSNTSLALGPSTVFYQCLSGTFYNLYDQSTGAQCNPVEIDVIGGGGAPAPAPATTAAVPPPAGATSVATQITDGQPQAASATPVCQITDGQLQATECVSQITDGQIQATSAVAAVSQLTEGQIQASAAGVATQITDGQPQVASATPVSQITDGQIQATTPAAVSQLTEGQIQASAAAVATQITDGQPQVASATPVCQITDGQVQATECVSQIGDGQIQATAAVAVSQLSEGQIQATAATPAPVMYTGAANPMAIGSNFFAVAAGAAAIAMF